MAAASVEELQEVEHGAVSDEVDEDGSVREEIDSQSREDGTLEESAAKRRNRHIHSFHSSPPTTAMSASEKVLKRLQSTASKKAKELTYVTL